MIPNKSNYEAPLQKNLGGLFSIPKNLLHKKYSHPHKSARQKLNIIEDTKWINQYLNFKKKKTKKTKTLDLTPKKQKKYIRPLSQKNKLIKPSVESQQGSLSNKENMKVNINLAVNTRKQDEQSVRFGILSKKSMVKPIDCAQLRQKQKRIKELQSHARRLSCQLSKETNKEGRQISETDQEQTDGYYDMKIEDFKGKRILHSVQHPKVLIGHMKKRKLSQRLKKSQDPAQKNGQVFAQPWEFRRSLIEEANQQSKELQNYVIKRQ